MVATETKSDVIVAPFGVEADHPRNDDLLLQSVPGARLRSAIDGSKHVIDAKTGRPQVPLDQSRHLASFPKIPGMQIHVNPDKCEYMIIDPLNEDEEACEQIRHFLRNQGQRVVDKVSGAKAISGKLDMHRMKTLCRELFNIVQSGEAKWTMKEGSVPPKLHNIDKLPGQYLLNPGSRVQNTQPIFEKDWDDWYEHLKKSGG